ncbi:MULTISPECIES: sensor histidine kinase [Brevundimonas]|uniref:sensor histidine kinase PhyK n=1 Tax=Brevundimonas TaxID=41275 RepID=UPI0013CEE0C2|nr:sensor histidine kinase [Brevundimonas lutea]
MAVALLPILLLGAVQAISGFRAEAEERRDDLTLAAELSAATARARLESAVILLDSIRPDTVGLSCAPRLQSLTQRSEGLDALYRYSASGRVVCASRTVDGQQDRQSDWFRRLVAGERVVLTQAPDDLADRPSLLAAVRVQRPLGRFDGAMAAVIPLSSLRPRLDPVALPEGSEVALVDARGAILTATDRAAFSDDPAVMARAVQPVDDAARLAEVEDVEGRDRVMASAPLYESEVHVVLSAPDPGWLSWARLNPVGVFAMPLAAWLAALLAVMWASDRIVVRWLDYLERIAAIYAKGRFSVRPVQSLNAPSEIQVLGKTLDELAENIEARDRSLTASLAEKDALLREIHHRVKNNLQIISSLLNLQQRALTDPAARAAIGDTRQRISALALIYRTLYQSADIRQADLGDFLGELTGQLVAADSGRGPLVTSSVEADSLIIDPDRLAPIALWAVEAISNAQKHAFAGRGGVLQVRFKRTGDGCVLEVEDDGPGAPEPGRSGVGLTLMNAFAKQLRGTAEVVSGAGGGTLARLTFPLPPEESA